MTRVHLRAALALALAARLLPGAASADDLRARIDAARARGAARAAEAPRLAPTIQEPSPDLWTIYRHHIPRQTILGVGRTMGNHARFLARGPRSSGPDAPRPGQQVYFYQQSSPGSPLRLAGRGEVMKVRGTRGGLVIEAYIFTSIWTRPEAATGNVLGMRVRSPVWSVQRLPPGASVPARGWWMSPDLLGPDVEGWDLAQRQSFVLGQPWVGMTRGALLALLGEPWWSGREGGEERLVFRRPGQVLGAAVRAGVVTELGAPPGMAPSVAAPPEPGPPEAATPGGTP